MRRISLLILILSVFCFVGNVFAQKSNFSGKWQLNLSRSKLDAFTRKSFNNITFEKIEMLISQQDLNITITDLIILKKLTSDENESFLTKDIQNTFQFITDNKLRLTEVKNSFIKNDGGFYRCFWFQGKLVINLFSIDKKKLMGTIELSLSKNEKVLTRSIKLVKKNSFNDQKIGNSVMIYDLSEK